MTSTTPARSPTTDLSGVFQDESIHGRWESVYRGNPLQDRFNDEMLDILLAQCGVHRGTVLDAGCGMGEHTLRFAQRGFRAFGVDVSVPVVLAARRAANERSLDAQFQPASLEALDLGMTFDLIHCRGVLMHIADWRRALSNLCSHLSPNGVILIWENNHRSLEMHLVRATRLFRKQARKKVATNDGIEFHDTKPGFAPLTRVANQEAIIRELERHDVDVIARRASEFFDINRFPAGRIRNTVIRMNRAAFHVAWLRRFACGNVIIGQRRSLD